MQNAIILPFIIAFKQPYIIFPCIHIYFHILLLHKKERKGQPEQQKIIM